jgi:hypothetical protein
MRGVLPNVLRETKPIRRRRRNILPELLPELTKSCSRSSGAFLAMIARLIAPIEMPATQSG